jgi:hypothetical protein
VPRPNPQTIRFPCHCGHRFEVPIEQAASAIQCPRCGLLNDVPALSDLQSYSDDGTVRLKEDAPAAHRPRRDPTVYTSFRRAHIDRTGEDVDLRNSYDDLANVGAEPEPDTIPLTGDERKTKPAKPKYDPVTGELIRPMPLAQTPDLTTPPDQIPVARPAHSLTYAAGDTRDVMTARRIFVEMLMPVNFIVILFVFAAHVFFQVATFVLFVLLAVAGLPVWIAQFPLAFLLMGHYTNTVTENAAEGKDELPRLLGSVSIGDDLWRPFVHMALAFMDAFLPAILCLMLVPPQFLAVTILPLGLGLFFFPAILLTTSTSGSTANLRPDRLAGVVRAAGGDYLFSFFCFLIALPTFVFALAGVYILPPHVLGAIPWIWKLNHPFVVYPVILFNVILMHFACWHLGVVYRRHHTAFPWVLQQHVSARRRLEAQQAAKVRALNRRRQQARRNAQTP